jgi:hypothetical protein
MTQEHHFMSLPVTVRPSEPENPAILVVVTLALAVTIMVLLISGCGIAPSQLANPTSSTTSQSISGRVHGGSPGQQVYLLAHGSNLGLPSGASNPAISLISPLGTCPNTGTFAGSVPALNIDEVSTVTAVYALAGFTTDATHVSSSASALAQQGVANAFLSTTNLVNIGPGLTVQASIAGNGVPPQATINTLANLLSACVNSTGASTLSSAPCPTLFANAKDSSGNLPSDTVSAMVNIAHNPGANVLALYNLAVPAAPNDWTIAITLYFTSMAGPYYPAFDASGNLWVPAYANNTLTEIDPRGIPISGQTGFSGNSLNQPYAIAIDSGQSAWVANYAYGKSAAVSRFSPNGSANGNFPCGTNCTAVAIDSLQNIWVAGRAGVYTMHNAGLPISQFSTSGSAPSLAIDSSGHGWSLGTSRNLYKLTLPNGVTPYSEAVSAPSPTTSPSSPSTPPTTSGSPQRQKQRARPSRLQRQPRLPILRLHRRRSHLPRPASHRRLQPRLGRQPRRQLHLRLLQLRRPHLPRHRLPTLRPGRPRPFDRPHQRRRPFPPRPRHRRLRQRLGNQLHRQLRHRVLRPRHPRRDPHLRRHPRPASLATSPPAYATA